MGLVATILDGAGEESTGWKTKKFNTCFSTNDMDHLGEVPLTYIASGLSSVDDGLN